ncbi:MAG: DNA-3-methyladenine glycosylase I [Candidatus Limnocylindrales bacterium]
MTLDRPAPAAQPVFDDRLPRCWWAPGTAQDPAMVEYHDREWGVATDDERELFERLALESFQAGLSWSTILHKRDAFRHAFQGFEPHVVAGFADADVERLLHDPGIVRNRAKIVATVGNARALLELQAAAGSFARYLAPYGTLPPRRLPPGATGQDVPSTTPASDRLSAELRARGMRFVGSTIVYAFMQSVGLVDDHLPGCFRYGAAG